MKTILYFEDDEMIGTIYTALFENEKKYDFYWVKTYSDYSKLTDNDKKFNPDLTLIDYNLTNETGFQIFDKLKTRHPNLKALLVSGDISDDLNSELLNKGFLGSIQKPIIFSDLKDTLEKYLKN